MKKLTSLTLLLLMIIPCLTMAQKKELSQARSILKSGKGIEQAEQLMTNLLKDSANWDNKKIYLLWYEAVLRQYQAVNEKLYMKQKQDTAQFFNLTYRLFSVAETLDSIDARPDKKGRVDPEYRRDNARRLLPFRPNLFFASTYFIRKGDFQRAYDFCEAYMETARQPLFSGYALDSADHRLPEAAYWATYSAFRLNDPVRTLRYRDAALRDSAKAMYTWQYIAEARRWLKDDSLYVASLQEGFRRFPANAYFYPRLMDYYMSHDQYENALTVVDRAIEANDSSLLTLYAKSTVLFNLGQLDESIGLCKLIIERNDSMPDAHYQAGICYMNKALALNPLREKKQQKKYYQCAKQYMERYRLLAPNDQDRWAPVLYRVYLNLNLGRQFDEIDRLLTKKR